MVNISLCNNSLLSLAWKYLVLLENRFHPWHCKLVTSVNSDSLKLDTFPNEWFSLKTNQTLYRALRSHSIIVLNSSSLSCIDSTKKQEVFMFCFHLSVSYTILNDYKLCFWRLGGGLELYHCSDTGKMASLFVDVVDSPYLNEFVLSCMMRNGELFFYYLESLTILNVSASSCIILYHCDDNICMWLWM